MKHCCGTIEECYIKNVFLVHSLPVKWICIYCNQIMDSTNFRDFINESNYDKNSNQRAVVEYHGWRLVLD